ncbi:Soluble lytic murein transglycosylase precursor [Roseivivax sp. THAF40]|uniref:lytic transglycosylase domain-containing protein n=1 Tax=unclassified Roseivivax TaxID=2639302 RepID=UPI00126947F2|nr:MULTISPECIES: lytic transglycosylase domain-containing protein [unclassified Roseivivax]QFS84509.1 Soluble lytic murein transglycosylase precursor [Roseivivax sp. THAF197b]QFT48337.1 Soluble lytic murein transglycosylase precursor [Roseivivax sp. THAF40]
MLSTTIGHVRLISLALWLCLTAGFATAQDGRALARAMADMRDGNWASAMIEARGDGQAALDVILWHYLRDGQGDARQVQDFVGRNADWPGMPYLREKSEEAIVEASHEDVRAFFADNRPQTGTGALSLARAFRHFGDDGAADAEVVLAWRTLAMSAEEHTAFLVEHGDLLKPHHAARLDMALWQGWEVNARRMLPLVSDGRRALAEARLGLADQVAGVDNLIAAVPEALAGDPGLAHARFIWRARKGRDADATELLLERSTSAMALGEPAAWARERQNLARSAMYDGEYAKAYQIASTHYLLGGSDFAALEWLSGYLALRFLDDPARAAQHFTDFRGAVDTPISLGRAGYWLGRALEAQGDVTGADGAYAFGAQYQTSFYGLLAAERAGLPPEPRLDGKEEFPDWRGADWTQTSVFEAAMLLMTIGEDWLAERFLTHLAERLDRTGVGQMGDMLAEMGKPHIQVMLGKRAAQAGLEVYGPYYPLHPLIERDFPVPTEMVLAIARRESEFDPVVVSGAGARGLMQLMPGTAQEVSGWLGVTYALEKLTRDPEFNATLGAAYLADLIDTFDGNVVMVAAGYNAGPSRPIRWMAERGDPRRGDMDVIDWIEFIPFAETRNYVMRVAESLPVYRARLGRDPHPVPFSEELTGSVLSARTP